MKPLKIIVPDYSQEPVTLRCTHARLWPPPLMRLDLDIETMWKSGEITQHDYQQIETWKRVCGLMEMGDKCLGCPLALLEKPRIGYEHHGRADLVPLHDEVRKAIAERNRASNLRNKQDKSSAPEPEPEPEPEPAPEETAQEEPATSPPEQPESSAAESFEPDPVEFRDETVNVKEPDYPIPKNGNGDAEVESFEEPKKSEGDTDADLDDLLDNLDDGED